MTAVYFAARVNGWEMRRRDGVSSITLARRWASNNGAFRLIVEHDNGFASGHMKDRGVWRERSLRWTIPEHFWYDDQLCITDCKKALRRIFVEALRKNTGEDGKITDT